MGAEVIKIVIKIGKRELELTMEEAQELKVALDGIGVYGHYLAPQYTWTERPQTPTYGKDAIRCNATSTEVKV